MLAYPAALLNLDLIILDPLPNAPSKQVLNHSGHLTGSFTDPQAIADLASKVDIITVEIEHVNTDALEAAQHVHAGRSIEVQPAPSTLRTIQDKFLQKQWLEGRSIPVAPFQSVDGTNAAVSLAGEQFGYPFMLKTRKLAYDGRGNFVVRSREDASNALKSLGCGNGESSMLYAEKWVPFTKELAVMVVRGKDGEVRSYPPVETIHRNSICHLVFAPLRAADPKVCTISHPF
jgi:phosphoribosylaminoimidazole carboxylase